MLQTGAGGGTSKLRSPERVAPSSVATSLNTCRGRRSSRRMGGGGLDDRRSRHDFVSSTDDGAARGIRARGGGGLVQQRAAGAGAGGWQRRQARSARRFRGGRKMGFKLVTISNEVGLMVNAAKAAIKEVRD